jgi:7,8-dihydropterin-6-yl-methyl-4-(beta-D-ribofuranosyl)aminobenzene 5'-phosphate synthase
MDEYLVVVTDCSHPGVVEIVRKVHESLAPPIHLVFGGFHLLNASPEGVRGVIRDLEQLGVERVGPTHCTGEEAIRVIQEGFGSDYVKVGAGRILRFQ